MRSIHRDIDGRTLVFSALFVLFVVSGPVPPTLRLAPVGSLRDPAFALELPEEASVQVKVYDFAGREVATLFDGVLGPGQRRFDLQSATRRLASGTYFARALVLSGERTDIRSARAILVH